MRRIIKTIAVILILFPGISCNGVQLKDEYACDGCLSYEPREAVLTVYFTRSTEQRSPEIVLYAGFWEEKNVLDTLKTDTVPAYRDFLLYRVSLDHYYTVAAIYIRGQDTVYAIDGSYVHKEQYYDADCDTLCWKISGNTLNVKLKNYIQ